LDVVIFLSLGLYAISPHSVGSWLSANPAQKVWQFFSKTQKQYLDDFTSLEKDAVRLCLINAIQNRNLDEVLRLLNLNFICPKITDGKGLLHVAIQQNDPLTLAALLAAHYYDQSGQRRNLCSVDDAVNELTPVMMAARNKQMEMVSLLMRQGAKMGMESIDGTVLHIAIHNNDYEMIFEILLWINNLSSDEKKVFLNKADSEGKTIFHIICEQFLDDRLDPVVFNAILLHAQYFSAVKRGDGAGEHIADEANRLNEYLKVNIDLILKKFKNNSWWGWICGRSKAILQQIWAFIGRSRTHIDTNRIIKGEIIRNLHLLKRNLNAPIVPMDRAQQPDAPQRVRMAPVHLQFFVPSEEIPGANADSIPPRQ
jgi:hypothetical protein